MTPITVLQHLQNSEDRRGHEGGEDRGVAGLDIHQLDALRPFHLYSHSISTLDQFPVDPRHRRTPPQRLRTSSTMN